MGYDLEKNPEKPTKKLSRFVKFAVTGSIFYSTFVLGSVLNCFGPAVKDFENKYETDVDTVSKIFTFTTIGYLIGALITGFIYNFLNRQLGVIIVVFGMSASVYLTPHASTLTLLYCVAGLLGFSCGAYDSSQIVWMMEIWQDKSGPFIQTQHFSYALGSLVPPLLLAPFLTKEEESEESSSSEESVTNTTSVSSTIEPYRNPDMYIPYTIIGAMVTIAVIWQLYLFLFKRYYPPPPEEGRFDAKPKDKEAVDSVDHNENSSSVVEINEKELSLFGLTIDIRRLKLIVLSAIFMGAIQGMEMCTMQFMPTFAQEGDLKLSESEGAYISSGVSGAYTLGRFLGIFAVLKIRPEIILIFNITTIICANLILLFFANSSVAMLWTGAIVIGLGFSTSYPSFCVYIERHLLFTNAVGAVMIITGSGIASIYPLVVGKYVEDNNVVLTYVIFFSLFWMLVSGGLIYKMTYKDAKKLGKE